MNGVCVSYERHWTTRLAKSMGLLHGSSAPCSPLEPKIGEGTGIMHMQLACSSGVLFRLFAVRKGMEMIGQSMFGRNVTHGVAPVDLLHRSEFSYSLPYGHSNAGWTKRSDC